MEPSVDSSQSPSIRDGVPFWLTPPAYWMPAHFPTSAWVTHASFAAWLMETVRPEVIVELGTHFGYSAFALAEAAKRLGLATTISALDTWEGDDHAGFYGDEVFDYVDTVSREDYPESVQLLRGRFDQSRALFAPSSVDILHIDGRHAYEDVYEDYSAWIDTVRDGGVVLFHDIAEKDNGFGVWRLWDEIASPGSSFAFEHGHGLGVLGVGTTRSPGLRALFEADEPTAALIRADFARLGESATHEAWLRSLPAELEAVRSELRDRVANERNQQEVMQVQEGRIHAQDARIDALTHSTSWRVTGPLRALGRLKPHQS